MDIPDDVAALFASTSSDGRGWLRRLLDDEFRRDGGRVPLVLARWLDALETHQRFHRISEDRNPQRLRPEHTVSTTEFARLAGTSPQAVRKRCSRGTLPAMQVDGQWRIFTDEGIPT